MIRHALASALCLTAALCTARAQDSKSEHESFEEKSCRPLPDGEEVLRAIDLDTGTIFNGQSAVELIVSLLNQTDFTPPCEPSPSSYRRRNFPDLLTSDEADRDLIKKADFILHVLRWGPQSGRTDDSLVQEVQQQRWYLVHHGEFLRPGRMFGGKRVYFLYLHLNKHPDTTYTVDYDFTIDEMVPANQQNLEKIASIFSPIDRDHKPLSHVWGGFQLDMWYGTSDISITSSKHDGDPGNSQTLDSSFKVHNEAPSWWDFSVGIPIRKMSQLSFNGASNALEPQEVDKKAIYGLINLYPFGQQRRDLVYSNFTWWPSVVFGLPTSQQPLHKPLVGLGVGPRFVQFYIGAIVRKQPELPAASTLAAGAARPCTGWCPQFAFGINLPIKALQSKFKSPPANAGTPGASKEGVGTGTKNQSR